MSKRKIPTFDPYTGEPNPHYEELTGEKNPLTGEIEKKYDSLPFCKEHIKGLIPPTKNKDLDKMINQKWHQTISFIKSGIRIVGYILIPFDLVIAASVLVFSEAIGILE